MLRDVLHRSSSNGRVIRSEETNEVLRGIGRPKAADATAKEYGRIMAKNNIRGEIGRCMHKLLRRARRREKQENMRLLLGMRF